MSPTPATHGVLAIEHFQWAGAGYAPTCPSQWPNPAGQAVLPLLHGRGNQGLGRHRCLSGGLRAREQQNQVLISVLPISKACALLSPSTYRRQRQHGPGRAVMSITPFRPTRLDCELIESTDHTLYFSWDLVTLPGKWENLTSSQMSPFKLSSM